MGTEQRAYRLPDELLARIRDYQRRLQESLPPGVTLNETAVVVSLLTRGLEVVEAEEPAPRRRGK